ncbi:Hypothetical predicted protein [Mytilus galloprovincialis]|uniref:Uncharacterized protein n=1 Tax=Mytilus galloprovincialis TaxID=29158 RepID=A0A8B6F7Y8_MYTGA|nr:Hypothetical predicted protein [Mytilus galloprovincialis]
MTWRRTLEAERLANINRHGAHYRKLPTTDKSGKSSLMSYTPMAHKGTSKRQGFGESGTDKIVTINFITNTTTGSIMLWGIHRRLSKPQIVSRRFDLELMIRYLSFVETSMSLQCVLSVNTMDNI